MKTFVINTVGLSNQLGIFDGTKVLAEYKSEAAAKRSGSENLLELSQDLFKKAKIKVVDLGLIIVVIGPGSYTGSRAGLAFAKAFSHASQIPIIGASRFDVAVYQDQDPEYPRTHNFDAGNGRTYSKDYTRFEELFEARDGGYIRESDTKSRYQNDVLDASETSLTHINSYGQEYFKRKGTDDYSKLLPLYLKEPNITLPKKK
jgi:tRNA threonylcarbamoyl adenosine modification protein YeaZ